VLQRYAQLKEDPIHIIVFNVQRVKRRAERATGLANGKCYEIRCGDCEEMTKDLADGSAEDEDDFAKGRAAVSKMNTTPVDAGAGRPRVERRPLTMRLIAVLGSALFLVIAPGTILGLGPWWITGWRFESPAWEALPLRVAGAVLILAGVPIVLESFARFALQGLGTPAPVAPPRQLVVTGVYRHVRNPIYVALTSIIVGQALLFGNVDLFWYAAIWVFVFIVAVFVHEEPELRATFGAEYETYCANVPRWLPRLRAWRG